MLSRQVLDVKSLRADFPIFRNSPHHYFDNASTTHKPAVVLQAIQDFYQAYYSNVHRGVYDLSIQASEALDQARSKVAQYLGAEASEVVFTCGTTDAINSVAYGLDKSLFSRGRNICVGASEHHANLIPWQELAKRFDLELRVLPLDANQCLDLQAAEQTISTETAIVAISHTSNVTGVRHPFEELTALSHRQGALVLLDAAQGMLSKPDVKSLDIDFLTFSGHKIFGPMGIGVLYGKREHLEHLNPMRFGGDMVRRVTYTTTEWAQVPRKFEAGTLPIAGAIGLAAALDYIQTWGANKLLQQAYDLSAIARQMLLDQGWKLMGSDDPGSIISFYDSAIHPHDIASIMAKYDIAIRGGHHCAQPFLRSLGLGATARLSFAAYNGTEELDVLAEALSEVKAIFK